MARQSFSQEQKNEALQLLSEGYTLKSVADQVGCSVASLQNWQQIARGQYIKDVETAATEAADTACTCTKPACTECDKPSFEQFARKFWEKRAVDVLLMDKSLNEAVLKYVNEALEYAYNEL